LSVNKLGQKQMIEINFQSTAFNCTDPKDYFINPCCFGDDVGKWLSAKISERGVPCGDVGQEDWGSYFTCEIDKQTFFVNIGFVEGEGWRLLLEHHVPFFKKLFQRPETTTVKLEHLVREILKSSPEIRCVK
jgi:hypothetical protein